MVFHRGLAKQSRAHHHGDIGHDPQGDAKAWCARQHQLYKHDWVVYAQTPLGGSAQILEYLSRYTHRTAIGNERIRAVSDQEVAFTVRANDQGGKRVLRLQGDEFVRRFLLHVLPIGIKCIRHYGVQASSCKGVKLNAARQALQMPLPHPQAMRSAQGFMARVAQMDVGVCPCCKIGRLHVSAVLPGSTRLPTPTCVVWPQGRGTPRAGVALRAALDKPGTGDKPHWPDTVMPAPACVCRHDCRQRAVRSPVIIRSNKWG